MNKVILTAPNGKVYIAKTKYDINDSFYSLAPSIKDSNRFFNEKDLKFIKETLMPKGRVTAIDAMQFHRSRLTYLHRTNGRKNIPS